MIGMGGHGPGESQKATDPRVRLQARLIAEAAVEERLRARRQARRTMRAEQALWAIICGILLVAALLGLAMLSQGCASGPRPEEAAALVRLSAIIGVCCQTAPVPECAGAVEDLHILGVGLSSGGAAEVLAVVWAVLRPGVERLVEVVMEWLLAAAGGGP